MGAATSFERSQQNLKIKTTAIINCKIHAINALNHDKSNMTLQSTINTKKETKFKDINSKAYQPRALAKKGKFAYWVDKNKGEVWLMDVINKKNTKLLNNAYCPEWISENELVVTDTGSYASNDERYGGPDFKAVSESRYNLTTKSKVSSKIWWPKSCYRFR